MLVRFRAEAANDVLSAQSWYDERQAGLGKEFVASLERTLGLISQVPSAFPEIGTAHRRALLKNFPYALYYRLHGDTIDVIACLHTRRSRDRWTRGR